MPSYRESILSDVGVKGVADGYTQHRTNEGTPLPSGAINKQEILRQTHLRRHIEQLREKKLQKEEEVERHRFELVAVTFYKTENVSAYKINGS